MSPLSLPVVTIQHTFPEVIQEVADGDIPSENFWISCYKTSEPSVHAKVKAELDENDRNLVNFDPADGKIEFSKDGDGGYSIACKPLGIPPTRVAAPLQEYRDEERSNASRPHRITAFSISPDSSRFATGYLDGSVLLYPTSTLDHTRKTLTPEVLDVTKSRTPSRPHLSGVTSLKFFPSSRVILSSGQDFSLTILPADVPDGPTPSTTRVSPVRTLRGHSRPVTDTAIVGVGRNIISSSLDATIKLWDTSSGEIISSLSSQSAILSMSLGNRMPTPPDGEEHPPPAATDPRQVPETSSKVIVCGLQSGEFQFFDLGFKKSIFRSPTSQTSSPVTSIAYSEVDNLLATGSASGVVTLYDTRSLGSSLTSFSRLETEIEDLAFVRSGTEVALAIATSDGLPYVANVLPEGPSVKIELIGADCDPVRNIAATTSEGRTEVWSASDDGVVRRYVI
ncbi:hypothetical protein NLJ89_g2701 [Agrocybe chaxingu]|uniref:WD40 repeat-like protein n=1 Tax=Agrocybe chaxingu TaxID=84603 RepID=A0A9W8MXX7_9AGAR|nr:hypothetical protein NLJ89_g2701 [Agrocybe chaxingu]